MMPFAMYKDISSVSCEESPSKLYKSPTAKWFCLDCDHYICDLCNDAHEKLKITRTHVITPYGTIILFKMKKLLMTQLIKMLINFGLQCFR